MTRPSRRGRSLPLTESQESTGTVDGDEIDWPTSPVVDEVAIDKWKQPVRVATTADLTISTGLNAGDTIDGVTLVAGDRVLVKDEAAPESNGIYVAGATPVLASDFDDPSDIVGTVVYVVDGTANAGTVWYCDLTDVPVIGVDPISFAPFGAGAGVPDGTDPGDLLAWDGAAWDVLPVGADGEMIYADSGESLGLLWDAAPSGSGGITVDDEGTPLSTAATTLDFVGAGVTASGTGATKTITIPGGGASGLVLLDTQTASAVSNVVFTTGISSTYSVYLLTLAGITVSTGSVLGLLCSTNGGSSYDTGNNYYFSQLSWSTGGVGAGGPGTAASITLAPFQGRTISTTANVVTEGHVYLYSLPSSAVYKSFLGEFMSPDSASSNAQRLGLTGRYNSTTAVNALKVLVNTGTFSGVMRLYGIAQ